MIRALALAATSLSLSCGGQTVAGCELVANGASVCVESTMSASYCRATFDGEPIDTGCAALDYPITCDGVITITRDGGGGLGDSEEAFSALDEQGCATADGARFVEP